MGFFLLVVFFWYVYVCVCVCVRVALVCFLSLVFGFVFCEGWRVVCVCVCVHACMRIFIKSTKASSVDKLAWIIEGLHINNLFWSYMFSSLINISTWSGKCVMCLHKKLIFQSSGAGVLAQRESGDLFKCTEVRRGKQTFWISKRRKGFRRGKAEAVGLRGEDRSHSISPITAWRRETP